MSNWKNWPLKKSVKTHMVETTETYISLPARYVGWVAQAGTERLHIFPSEVDPDKVVVTAYCGTTMSTFHLDQTEALAKGSVSIPISEALVAACCPRTRRGMRTRRLYVVPDSDGVNRMYIAEARSHSAIPKIVYEVHGWTMDTVTKKPDDYERWSNIVRPCLSGESIPEAVMGLGWSAETLGRFSFRNVGHVMPWAASLISSLYPRCVEIPHGPFALVVFNCAYQNWFGVVAPSQAREDFDPEVQAKVVLGNLLKV